MLTMDKVHTIREAFYEQGKNLSEIAKDMGLDWRTVRKYVDMEDFSPKAPTPESARKHTSKLDPYKKTIDTWLSDDKKNNRKQRHTAKRVYNRLKEEFPDFDCSYRLVVDYVMKKKEDLNLKKSEGFIPLIHNPGEAQADFGFAAFVENGHRYEERKYFVMSFPHSNGGYLQLNYGENMECLLESLQSMFEHLQGVPTEIWFDNTSTIVIKIIKGGGRVITERFQRFVEHYGFKPIFMNPNEGHEKGNVENKVGYLRRNLLVPVPEFEKLSEKNAELLKSCDENMNREHYDKTLKISELFEEDKAALLPLPTIRFDTAKYTTATTDKYGKFTLEEGKFRYSVSPRYSEVTVWLKITSGEVIVRDSNMREIVRHRRLYAGDPHESMDWIPYLQYIARRPRSLRNSGIYEMMPEAMREYMDACPNTDRGVILKTLYELTERNGFESALKTVEEAIHLQARDADSLKALHRRLFSEVPLLPPLDNSLNSNLGKIIPLRNDLASYDQILKGGVLHG